MIGSYAKIWALGHSAVAELLLDDVVVQEKCDGSQFSFGVFNGELHCRSKGQHLVIDAPEKMFALGIESAKERSQLLPDGWVYRCEYLQKPKHNALAYDRVPEGHLVIFDVCPSLEAYLPPDRIASEAERIGLESMPLLFHGRVDSADDVRGFLDRTSFLGGQKIEGVVIKNYSRFGPDKKALMGKFVSEAFKEVHRNDWKKTNPTKGDVLQELINSYRSKARWNKAVQHLAERGELTNSPRDIGVLIKEAQADIATECEAEIKDALWQWAKPHVLRGAIAGLPEFYKQQLLDRQFEGSEQNGDAS